MKNTTDFKDLPYASQLTAPISSENTEPEQDINTSRTLEDLLKMEDEDFPNLLEPILLQVGLAGIIGSSDTGKSCLGRQLALDIIEGNTHSIGFLLNTIHKRAIYASTEDGAGSTRSAFKKMLAGKECSNPAGLRFIFEQDNLPKQLDKMLADEPADLVVVDAYLDVAPLESNNASHTRQLLHKYRTVANKYQTLILFVHHTGKAARNQSPSKHGAVGSQSWEAKLRAVIELRTDSQDPYKKHLCVVKGNEISQEYKNSSFVLEFDEDTLTFTNTGERLKFEEMATDQTQGFGGHKKGFDPGSIPEQQHDAWINSVFAKESSLMYKDITEGLKNVTGYGMNKITQNLLPHYLSSEKVIKNNGRYVKPAPF